MTYFEGTQRFVRESPIEFAEGLYQKVISAESETFLINLVNRIIWLLFALIHSAIPIHTYSLSSIALA